MDTNYYCVVWQYDRWVTTRRDSCSRSAALLDCIEASRDRQKARLLTANEWRLEQMKGTK